MNVVREINKINVKELATLRADKDDQGSWHDDYKDSAYIFIGGLDFDLTEGDVICIFSQYGEILDINLVRDKDTGKSKGFAFIAYEDQRSTVLAVDNFNGVSIAGRTIRVDHVRDYKQKKKPNDIGAEDDDGPSAREILQSERNHHFETGNKNNLGISSSRKKDHEDEDPMAQYFRAKKE